MGLAMSIIAMAFYAMEIFLTDWKFAGLSPRLVTACYAVGVAVFALISLMITREPVEPPTLKQSGFILLMVLSSFIAASTHFQALHLHAGAVQLTLVYCLLPVAASAYTAIFEQKLPSLQMILAWILAGGALYLVATAQTTKV